MSVKQFFEIERKEKKGNKYNAKKTEFNGHIFDSKHEAKVAEDLELEKHEKNPVDQILSIEYHPPRYDMIVNGLKITHYTADFKVTRRSGKVEIIDAKSDPTRKKRDYVIRKKLLKALYGIDIIEK